MQGGVCLYGIGAGGGVVRGFACVLLYNVVVLLTGFDKDRYYT